MKLDEKQEFITSYLLTSADVKRQVGEVCGPDILRAATAIAGAVANGGKILLCGNGGSAADCQHMAAEFVSRLTADFVRPAIPAVALTTDTSFLTAFTNDINVDDVFARQVEALGGPADVLVGISTSGRSRNVVRAVETARRKGLTTVVLVGQGGVLADIADVAVRVPSGSTQHIQESHLAVEHLICHLVERDLYTTAE